MSEDASLKKTAFIVFEQKTTGEIANWLEGLFGKGLEGYTIQRLDSAEAEFFPKFQAALPSRHSVKDAATGEEVMKLPPTVVITVFFDGQSDQSKAVFLEFRTWAAKEGAENVCLQALNSKKGTHTLMNNEAAVLSTIVKKLPKDPSADPAAAGAATTGAGDAEGGGGESKKPLSSRFADPNAISMQQILIPTSFELTQENIEKVVTSGQGECYWTVSTQPDAFEEAAALLRTQCKKANIGVCAMCDPRLVAAPESAEAEGNNNNSSSKKKADATEEDSSSAETTTATKAKEYQGKFMAQEFCLRKDDEDQHIEMRLAMCGNVDSGKSTLTSVLTRGYKDDGRGLARSKVFNHKHEADTGRTSSISENYLGYDGEGNVVNYPKGGPMSTKHHITAQEMSSRSGKIVTLYDLAGHEKYLKTTVLGMTRSMPDYSCIVISANNGIQRMTKEHLGLCLALQLPFFIVVTRIDATPDNVRTQTNATILKLLKMPTVKKIAYPIKKEEDVVVCAKNLRADRICPIFEVSNVTGLNIDLVSKFINLLPVRKDWQSLVNLPKEMIIDSTFFVTGVGTVVGGIIAQGTFKVNDTVLLGPDGLGQYRQSQIKSIHVKGVDVDHVCAGNDAALCLKKEKRSAIRKGNVLICPTLNPKAYWQFEAEIVILYHSTTISSDYEPVIHSQTVRQSARIVLVDQEVLRTGDRAKVRFHFLYRPEYMKVGHRLVFREGRTKGIGTVTKLIEGAVTGQGTPAIGDSRSQAKEVVRVKHQKKDQPGSGGATAGGQ